MAAGRISKYAVSFSETPEWHCGVYLRLSREDGDKLESDSIVNQRKIVDRYLSKNDDLNVYDFYIDDGFTGSNFDRPALKRLLEDIKSRKVNCILVKDLSRFGRNYYETGRYLEVVFPLLQVRFIAINDFIDSYKDPQSCQNASASFKNVMNDEYCKDISRKVKSSFQAKKKRGEYLGAVALYGYRKDPEDRHKLLVDPEAAETVRLIYRLFAEGYSIYNIGLQLDERGIPNPTKYKQLKGIKDNHKLGQSGGWSSQTIRRILQNEMYLGKMIQGKSRKVSPRLKTLVAVPKENFIVVEGTHEAIITEGEFQKARERFGRDSWQVRGARELKEDFITGALFVGMMKCADCGRAMQRTGRMDGDNPLYYFVCGTYRQWRQCTRRAIRVKKLAETVLKTIQLLVGIAVDMEKLLQAIEKSPSKAQALSELSREIEMRERQREKLLRLQNDLYLDLKNELLSKEQYLYFREDYKKQITFLEEQIKKLRERYAAEEENLAHNCFVETFKRYRTITTLSREVLSELIETIYVEKDGKLKIIFRFQDEFQRALSITRSRGEHEGSVEPEFAGD